MDNDPYLSVRDLTVCFSESEEPTVRNVSFDINCGETLALVGNSGSGKALIAMSFMRVQPDVAIAGEIILSGSRYWIYRFPS